MGPALWSAWSSSCRSKRTAVPRSRSWLLAGAVSASLIAIGEARAAPLQVPAGRLDAAVATIARQANVSIGFQGALPDLRTPPLRGSFSVEEALARLLAESDLVVVRLDGTTFRIERRAPSTIPRQPAAPVQELVVVGTKRRETLASVPFSMSVLRPESEPDLQGRTPTTGDVVALAGDVQLTNLGPGRNRLFIRGVADSAFAGPTQSTVSIYLDDARISFDTPDPDLRLVDVERLEVLKGPQGALYGTGALGGIYRIVPNRPRIGSWSGRLATEVGARADGAPGGTVEGSVNIPIHDRAALRLVGYAVSDGGWIDDLQRRRGDVNRVTTVGGRASALVILPANWSAELAATAQSIQARDAQYAVATSGARARRSAIAQPSDSNFANLRLALAGAIQDIEVNSTTSVLTHDIDNRYDASASAGLAPSLPDSVYRENQSLRMMTHETRLSDPSRQRPWVAGVSLMTARSSFRGVVEGSDSRRVPVSRLRRDFTEAAVYGEASQALPLRLQATLGARLALTNAEDETDRSGQEGVESLSATPMAALSWRPRQGLQVYARFASASRPGGLNPLGVPVRFDSDELQSFEAGARYRDPSGAFSVSLDTFRIRWTDIQSDALQPNGLIATSNVGVAHNLGGEISFKARLDYGWRLETAGVIQEAEIRPTAQGARKESGLPAIPDVSGRAAVLRDFSLGPISASLGVTARYVGRSRLTFDPALDRRMGDYAVLDLAASASHGLWRLDLAVANLLDRDADTFSYGNPFAVRIEDQRVPLAPRTWRVRLERGF